MQRSLGAAGTGVDDAALVGRTEEFLEQAAPDPETAGAITAFHGSPYDFDAFDISKMGTGEGAQAYGPGLYFAEAERVAREYRDNLSPPPMAVFPDDPELMQKIRTNNSAVDRLVDDLQFAQTQDQYDAINREIEKLNAETQSILGTDKSTGRVYEVNIRAEPEDFLNWDAPISQQSEKVREVLMPFVEQRIAKMGEAGNRFTPEQWMDRLRGGDVMLLDKVGDTPVSRAMIEAGIPGVRYLDQASRGAGEGTRNIVVFDDQLIDIVKKYGVAGLAVGAAVQSELGGNQQIEENI